MLLVIVLWVTMNDCRWGGCLCLQSTLSKNSTWITVHPTYFLNMKAQPFLEHTSSKPSTIGRGKLFETKYATFKSWEGPNHFLWRVRLSPKLFGPLSNPLFTAYLRANLNFDLLLLHNQLRIYKCLSFSLGRLRSYSASSEIATVSMI